MAARSRAWSRRRAPPHRHSSHAVLAITAVVTMRMLRVLRITELSCGGTFATPSWDVPKMNAPYMRPARTPKAATPAGHSHAGAFLVAMETLLFVEGWGLVG